MLHDPARIADTGAWLKKADTDCKAGRFQLTAAPPFVADALFHAQQAAEKALKGFLAWHDVPFRKTHDLAEIGRQCVEIDASLGPLLSRAAALTVYAWRFRYPGDVGEPIQEEAERALALAREVVDSIVARVPPEARP